VSSAADTHRAYVLSIPHAHSSPRIAVASRRMDDERRKGYEMAFEGIRLVLTQTPDDDPDHEDLLRCYRALGDLARRPPLELAPPPPPGEPARARSG
jgi:hypothetical protein